MMNSPAVNPIRRCIAAGALAVVLAGATRPVAAEGLDRYVPDDVHLFSAWKIPGTPHPVTEEFAEAWGRLAASGIGDDIVDVATHALRPEARREVRAVIERVVRLVRTPDWAALFRKEAAFAFRLTVPFPEYAFLFRVPEDSVHARLDEFEKAFEGFAAFGRGAIEVVRKEHGEARIVRLGAVEAPVPIGLTAAGRDGLVVLCTSDLLLDEILGLLEVDDGVGSLAGSSRLAQAMRGLPEGEVRTFFDLRGYLRFVRQMVVMAKIPVQNDPALAGLVEFGVSVLDELSRLERIGTSERMQGNRYVLDSRVQFARGAGPGFVESRIAEQQPVGEFVKAVPRDACCFRLSSGMRPAALYDALENAVRRYCPEGEEVLGAWEKVQTKAGFDLRDDLLAWIGGERGWIVLPDASGCGVECGVFLRVIDADKAREAVEGFLEKCEGFVESRGHKMDLVPVEGLEPLREVRIDALPWWRPVVGIVEGHLVLTSSADAARRIHATFYGEAPSIAEHPDFAAAKTPSGDVVEVSYADLGGSLTAFANLLGTVGFAATLAPELHEDAPPFRKLGAIATKLARFLRDIDLATSEAGWTRYDRDSHALIGRCITTFQADRE